MKKKERKMRENKKSYDENEGELGHIIIMIKRKINKKIYTIQEYKEKKGKK